MEVKVGKYTFVITENIESWNGITTNINYKIGGNIRDCVNISIHFDNNVAVSASMPTAMFDEECSITPLRILNAQRLPTFALINRRQVGVLNVQRCKEPLGRGEGSVIMIQTLLEHIRRLYPQLKKIKFDDMSSIECASENELERNRLRPRKKGTNLVPMPLYYLSIAYNGQTWYEKYFNAVQDDKVKQNEYRSRVDKMLNDQTTKPLDYIQFLKITNVPMNIREELESYFTNSTTYSGFFHSIPKKDRCRLVRPWIKEFMNFYLKGVFSNFDWEIELSNIRGGKRKTRKTRKKINKSKKKYYCPRGFKREMNILQEIYADDDFCR